MKNQSLNVGRHNFNINDYFDNPHGKYNEPETRKKMTKWQDFLIVVKFWAY